jgi:hypothetical protein
MLLFKRWLRFILNLPRYQDIFGVFTFYLLKEHITFQIICMLLKGEVPRYFESIRLYWSW